MIKIVQGNLLDASEDILGHQVNAKQTMGSGVARFLREKYPTVFSEYVAYSRQYDDPSELLGECQIVQCEGKQVANLFGQLDFGRSDKVYTQYDALFSALAKLKKYAVKNELSVALPFQIGCGLANGDWDIVKNMIDDVFKDYEVTLYKIQ